MYLDLLVRWLEKNDEDIPERVVFHGDITMVESVKTPPTETKQTKVMIVMFGWEGSPIRKKNTKSEKYMENTQRPLFSLNKQNWLVVSTHLKNISQNGNHFPKDRGETKKYLSCHHPEKLSFTKTNWTLRHQIIFRVGSVGIANSIMTSPWPRAEIAPGFLGTTKMTGKIYRNNQLRKEHEVKNCGLFL